MASLGKVRGPGSQARGPMGGLTDVGWGGPTENSIARNGGEEGWVGGPGAGGRPSWHSGLWGPPPRITLSSFTAPVLFYEKQASSLQ